MVLGGCLAIISRLGVLGLYFGIFFSQIAFFPYFFSFHQPLRQH